MNHDASPAVADLDEAAFDAALRQPGAPPLLLDLWAPWCAPCLAMAPGLQRLAEAAEGRLRVAKLDIDRNDSVARRCVVRSIPCLILFKEGIEVSRRTGLQSREQLVRWLGAEGLDVRGLGHAFQSDPASWGAFYGDEALRGFLGQRWLAAAGAGRLVPSRFPVWSEQRATVSASLVRSARPEVFERVTGLPYAFACAMEFAGVSTVDDVATLFAALPVDADLREVPIRLVMRWLADPEMPWQALLDDAAAEALRLQWLDTSKAALSAEGVTRSAWSALHAEAASLASSEPERSVQDHFGRLLEALSPPPPPDDAGAWLGALLGLGVYLQCTLVQSRLGWTRSNFAMELFRHRWYQAHVPHPESLTADEMTAWHRRYEAENAEAEARHAPLERGFHKDLAAHMKPMTDRLQGHLLALMQQAPKA